MKYIIYAAVAALILWAVVCLVRHVRRQLRGECGGGGGSCGGDCTSCGQSCGKRR